MIRLILGVVALVLFAPCASAWNYAGHMLSAYVAYKRLSPGPKAHIDDILRRHPDYPKWVSGAPAGADLGLEAFLQASIWPDAIKGDPRFWEPGSRTSSMPTPLLPGYPDMEQHRDWHYRDRALAPAGVTAPTASEENLVSKLRLFEAALDNPYNLSWAIHLVGDAHQPLHSVSRYQSAGDEGDHGGNAVIIDDPAKNLHAFWDQAGDRDLERAAIQAAGDRLLAQGPAAAAVARTDIETWMSESFEIARKFVYTATPPVLTEKYKTRASEIARERIGLAGFRLAAILNERLQ